MNVMLIKTKSYIFPNEFTFSFEGIEEVGEKIRRSRADSSERGLEEKIREHAPRKYRHILRTNELRDVHSATKHKTHPQHRISHRHNKIAH